MSRKRPGPIAIAAVWVLPSLLLIALAWSVQRHYHIPTPAPLSDNARSAVMAYLRAALVTREADPPTHPELARALPGGGPVNVTLWGYGNRKAQAWGRGPTLAAALKDAADQLLANPRLSYLSQGFLAQSRFKVDIVLGRGPIASEPGLRRSLGLHPGLEGLGVSVEHEGPDGAQRGEFWLLPDELIDQRLLVGERPLSFVPDFRIGLSFARADKVLEGRARKAMKLAEGDYFAAQRRYVRFRTLSFVEAVGADQTRAAPLVLTRGLPESSPPVTADNLRAAAIAGGRYLVAHLADTGRYVYERNLVTGKASDPRGKGPYSIPRHAGTTYFLAELYRLTGESFLREPIERAFAHLSELLAEGGCHGQLPDGAPFACVVDRGHKDAHLGSTALTVVALVEYRRATQDRRYDSLMLQLAEWLLYMQRPDGSFVHVYHVPSGQKRERQQLLYYSGEAALALARMHAEFGDARYRDAAEQALDRIISWYDFFIGGFFFGEEHWTCIAAEAIYPAVASPRYVDFCHDYAAFLRDQQVGPGEFANQQDYAGSYTVTPYLVPMNTPAGSRTESMISTYLLGRAQGRPDPAVLQQIRAALGYLLGQQMRQESAFFIPSRVPGLGAVPASPIDRSVRIDYVQHVASAMIRAAELMEDPDT